MPSAPLLTIFENARRRKFLGNVPIESHIQNAQGFAHVLRHIEARVIVDLGSGGGVPGLVIAEELPDTSVTLIERSSNRAAFLDSAIAELDLEARVRVVACSAERAARMLEIESAADAVTARGFAPPAVTAECACRMLAHGGALIVSEPPINDSHSSTSRWLAAELAPTGLEPTELIRWGPNSFQILRRTSDHDPRLPRNESVTRKRPLF